MFCVLPLKSGFMIESHTVCKFSPNAALSADRYDFSRF